MKYAVIDCRMSEKCRASLKRFGFELIEITENPNLDKPISAHPDISVFSYGNIVITENRSTTVVLEHLFIKGGQIYKLTEGCYFKNKTIYPYDCVLNFAVCGKHLIGNMRYVNEEILSIADEYNLILVDVKQGYAKCNICVVSDNALITEDKGIANKCREYGIDVLLLENNSVKLDGYEYGFIGGASGTMFGNESNTILFCGCVEKHPQFEDIKMFCKKHRAETISLSDEDLYDYGSIIILQ